MGIYGNGTLLYVLDCILDEPELVYMEDPDDLEGDVSGDFSGGRIASKNVDNVVFFSFMFTGPADLYVLWVSGESTEEDPDTGMY